ncbi:MAG TPA: flagellar hook protein FlgE [Bryobacteraceae bacterium]|jgi:flagellar hook protein FlgE|nr:flagellar hook protein FlgE [Bryobacteraceae bacterium]
MSSTFSIALSALQAQSEAIDTTGNDLANLNTTGFKGNTVAFKDLFNQALGANSQFQVGLGVGVPISDTDFGQGAIQSSTSPYAAAIQGNGFFVVNNPSGQQLYTRDGDFTLDSSGTLKTQTGETVQGWTATASGLNTSVAPSDIVLPTGSVLPPVTSTQFSITANLDAAGVAGQTSGTVSAPVQVVDSLGNTHTLTFTFTKSATTANTWNYSATIPGADVSAGTSGSPYTVPGASGTLTFDANGNIQSATPTGATAPASGPIPITLSGLTDGAGNLSLNWNTTDSSGTGLFTQYAETSSSSYKTDGSAAAQLSGFAIQTGGQLVATYSNGKQQVEAQLALASIQNPSSLSSVGNNNYAATNQTATAAIGVPQSGGRGQIDGGALEASNVDMATQFTNLIVYQSGYQAASKVITTANTMTQDLLNIIH